MKNLLAHAQDVLADVTDTHLNQALFSAFSASEDSLQKIEKCFKTLVSIPKSSDFLYPFFHNWSMTNNSATGLSGYCNRCTLLWRDSDEKSPERNADFLTLLAHLNRVTDEDLGANGGTLHYELYYQMATLICGDDKWMSRTHLLQEGETFKTWKDTQLLREKDLFVGLLTTLVHEIYTHSEVEFILPLFRQWLMEQFDLTPQERRRALTWIVVHTAGTERNHFNETMQSIDSISRILNKSLLDYDLKAMFSEYLSKKAATMDALTTYMLAHTNKEDAVFAAE